MNIRPAFPILVLLCTASAFCGPGLPAHEAEETAPPQPRGGRVLGEIEFPVDTGVPEAREAFVEGMLLLHLFEYPEAREQFLLAQRLDPALVMAYWGEAMTYNHPIWDRQDRAAARAAMLKLGATPEERVARGRNGREQGFLAALEFLYGPGPKAQRDQAYMRALEQLAAALPEDHEVQLFYALSLFGVRAGVRDITTYMLCTAIAQGVFSENPRHPGAAHYLIHGVDDPVHAVLGLRAARALAGMAPDAGHAQHMTSHIFVAVGMWPEVVAANQAALKVQNVARAERGQAARNWGHYNYWLLYGYLQQGREQRAGELLDAAYAELQAGKPPPGDPLDLDPDGSIVGSVVQMWARFLIETRRFDDPRADWTFATEGAFDPELNIAFVRTLQAAFGGRLAEAEAQRQRFVELRERLAEVLGRQAETAPGDLLYLERLQVMTEELSALLEMVRGNLTAAVARAREASRLEGAMPYSFGPPFVDLPSAELWGDLLLQSGDFPAAAEAYELQLERARLKARALEGLAAVQEAAGLAAEARYQRLRLEQVRGGDEAEAAAAESEP